METLIVKGRILSKNLTEMDYEDIIIKYKGLDDKMNMVYTYSLPKHLYDNLVDSSDEYQSYQKYMDKKKELGANFPYSEKYLKKNVEEILISNVLSTIEMYSQIVINNNSRNELKKSKKIFIKFFSSNTHDRCNWTGGYKGVKVSSDFQFFVGYEVEEPAPLRNSINWDNKPNKPMVINYYTLIKHALGSMAKWSTNGKEGTHLEPLYHSGKKEEFLNSYNVVEWTQEREDYLTDLQNKFIALNENLDSFLGNLDNEKLDLLVSNINKIKLLT